MSKTVTVKRGEKLPENMLSKSITVQRRIIYNGTAILGPGDDVPTDAVCEFFTVEVTDDLPLQAYLIVPCEPGKGTHWHEQDDAQLWGCTKASAFDSTHKQIPCPLTLEDLQTLKKFADRLCVSRDALTHARQRLTDTIAAWSAVPQPKEATK